MSKSSIAVVVLNWNDADLLPHSVGSLQKQSLPCDIIVVDNGSTDNSSRVINDFGDKISTVWNDKNLGFAGGVNAGIRFALEEGYEFIGLLNNDATADKDWVKHLSKALQSNTKLGGVTCSLIHRSGDHYDSTGDFYSLWGLPFPRGRGQPVTGQFDKSLKIMAPSGGASLFRAKFFNEVGLFDEDFFAYYEDVDLGLRGLACGWQFNFVPNAKVLHATGSTSSRVKDFTTYQTLKNLPMLFWKNVPLGLLWRMWPRFTVAYCLFSLRALSRLQFLPIVKSALVLCWLLPKKFFWRTFSKPGSNTKLFKSLLVMDLPENASALKKFRKIVRKVMPNFV